MDQLQPDPGSIPEASTSDTNAATEGTTATGAAGATIGMTGDGDAVTGVVATDVVVVVTTGDATVVVVVVV
jgi:hypothetical protein